MNQDCFIISFVRVIITEIVKKMSDTYYLKFFKIIIIIREIYLSLVIVTELISIFQ